MSRAPLRGVVQAPLHELPDGGRHAGDIAGVTLVARLQLGSRERPLEDGARGEEPEAEWHCLIRQVDRLRRVAQGPGGESAEDAGEERIAQRPEALARVVDDAVGAERVQAAELAEDVFGRAGLGDRVGERERVGGRIGDEVPVDGTRRRRGARSGPAVGIDDRLQLEALLARQPGEVVAHPVDRERHVAELVGVVGPESLHPGGKLGSAPVAIEARATELVPGRAAVIWPCPPGLARHVVDAPQRVQPQPRIDVLVAELRTRQCGGEEFAKR